MKKSLLIIIFLSNITLFAVETQTVHSSASLYYEMKNFSNSLQKDDGVLYGVAADVHYKDSEFRMAYERADTNTKKPPLSKNLENEILFLKYAHQLNSAFTLNVNYINVLHDNLVPTDKSFAYGAGVTYNYDKSLSINFTQYYVDYKNFESYQSDLNIDKKLKYKAINYKLSLIGKQIFLQHKDSNNFSKNAQNDYTTIGVKLHAHYETYHLGMGAFFGKRAFAIMNDGFKIQHHAMEIDRTYAIGVGKSFGDFVLRYQYVYQRAKELPMQNKDVDVSTNRLTLNYKF